MPRNSSFLEQLEGFDWTPRRRWVYEETRRAIGARSLGIENREATVESLQKISRQAEVNTKMWKRTFATLNRNRLILSNLQMAGETSFRVVVEDDDHTTEACHRFSGQVFSISEARAGLNLPPFHYNCRCRIEGVSNAVNIFRESLTSFEWIFLRNFEFYGSIADMEAAIELYRLLNALEPRPRNPELGREAVLALNPGLTNGEAAFIWQAFSYSTWGGGMTVETGRRFAAFGLMYHGALSLSGSLFRGGSVRVAPRTAPRATPRAGGGVAQSGIMHRNFNQVAQQTTPRQLIRTLERAGWRKSVEAGGGRSGPATVLTDPATGTTVRIHMTPAKGARPYFRVRNAGGNYLDSNGLFPSNATRQQVRDLTHFYFGN